MADAQRDELFADQPALFVAADDTRELHAGPKRAHVVSDICGTTDPVGFVIEADDGDRRFGRDSIDASHDEMIQHDVADDQDRRIGEALDDVAGATGREELRQRVPARPRTEG